MIKIGIIIQARTSSSRLPNKVISDIEGRPLLWHIINRLKRSKYNPDIIIATSSLENDIKILEIAEESDVKSYAGSIDDVLDRVYQAALKYNLEIIGRITADCPFIDPDVLDKVLEFFLKGEYDYVSNTLPPTYPDGLDVEVFTFNALKKAWKEAKLTSEREHVTPYIRKNRALYKIGNLECEEDLAELRWTVDEREDLEFTRKVYNYLYPKKEIFLMKDILTLLSEKPELEKINIKYERDEGYKKSLKEDRVIK